MPAFEVKTVEAVVVLTAYNGARMIGRQLDSLRKQTCPIRVLIRDDGSTDDTVRIIEDYIRSYNLDSWQLVKNPENLGWKRNFMEGMRSCGGDVIFPCDQDDIWYPEKVETMLREMEAHQEILLLSCDMSIRYEENAIRAKVYHRKKAEQAQPVAKYVFSNQFFKNPRPGCSYAIRRSFFDSVKKYWRPDYPRLPSLISGLRTLNCRKKT